MRVQCFTSLDELVPYADDWQRLSGGVPFRSWTWLSHWWRHYGPQHNADRRRQLAVLGVFDYTDAIVGIAPWYVEHTAMYGRVLRPLGSGEVCSDYLSILCPEHLNETVAEVLAEYLLEDRTFAWDLLDFVGIEDNDRSIRHFVHCLKVVGSIVDRRPGLNCWRLTLPLDWESYVATLGKNLRRDVHRIERELLNTSRAALHNIDDPENLQRAMQILEELHGKRRATLGEKGCFASPQFLRFYHDVVPELFRRGLVEFYWLEIDGRPVAAEFQLVGRGTLYAYQAGIDPESIKLQPGKAIFLAILRRAIERGNRAFDFLRGDEPYKSRFGAAPRATVNYRVVARRMIPRVRHSLWLAGKSVKQIAKRRSKNEEQV